MLRIPWKTTVGLFQEASIDPIIKKHLDANRFKRVILGGGYSTMSIVRDALFELVFIRLTNWFRVTRSRRNKSSPQIVKSISWRERFVREYNDLSWHETINSWDVHPGLADSPLQGNFKRRHSALHLDRESVTFVVKTKDKNGKPYSIEIDDLGTTISSGILTGDCPQTREELGSEILNSTTTDKNSSTSTCRSYATSSSSNIGINTSPDDASSQASNSINPVTPTLSFVDPLENIECDSRNLKSLLSQNHKASKKLEDPFSFNHSQPKSALFQPARRPRKGLESKEALTSETPQVPRPKTVDDIGLPIIDDSQDTDELSLLVWLLLSPPVPEESIVVRYRRVSFTSPSRFE
ncbi:predicted protein [Botrytis cinerea T4]|uniref:Uncharacterized protein n=1 Tax=Botryotinia fuckeliana (strain T4) TaxID=999810 RepID=G2YYC0_BOTF4|nr:predicted protein [Botrytis cinerea T4]